MDVKELFLTDQVTDHGNGKYSATPIRFDRYDALLPFFLPCKIFCKLAFEKDDPRDLDIDLRVLDPKGEPCGFMENENHNSTTSLLQCSISVESGAHEWAGVLDMHGLTFHTDGPHSILLIVNGMPLNALQFVVASPLAPRPD